MLLTKDLLDRYIVTIPAETFLTPTTPGTLSISLREVGVKPR